MLSTPLTLFTWLLGQVLNNSYLCQTLFGFELLNPVYSQIKIFFTGMTN